jgi:hypothetical protein
MLRTSVVVALVLLMTCSSAAVEPAIVEVIRGGLTAEQTAFIPQPPVCPGPVSDAVRQQVVAHIPIALGAYFTSPQLETDIARATNVVTGSKAGVECVYSGGVDWVRLDSVSTSGTTMAARGQVRLWSRIAQWQESGPKFAEPHDTLDASFHLVRIAGRWLISRYDWKFAPGSGP